jgi:hypothetical protein
VLEANDFLGNNGFQDVKVYKKNGRSPDIKAHVKSML